MKQFNVFENGAPFPGTCVGCRSNINLYDLGIDLLSGGNAMLCRQCINDLAEFTGQAPKQPLLDEIAALKAEIVSRETELKAVPNLVEELINGIRTTVTNFVLAVSDSSSPSSKNSVSESTPSSAGHSKTVETAERHHKAPKQPTSNQRPAGVSTSPSSHS